jgi:hypothetical protein
MPPRLSIFRSAHRALTSARPAAISRGPVYSLPIRGYANSEKPAAETPKGPTQDVLPHVSEEAGAMADITGETKPEYEEQGTPVQEVNDSFSMHSGIGSTDIIDRFSNVITKPKRKLHKSLKMRSTTHPPRTRLLLHL